MKIIGFTGTMGCGKSTAIDCLKRFQKNEVFNVKFAQPLYDMQEFIYERIKFAYIRPETFVKDRKLLQWIGTEWGRDTISKTLWVDLWKAASVELNYYNPNGIIVCDDVRFDNEAETIRSLGGHIIKINSQKALDRITTNNGISGHQSEAGLDPTLVDYQVDNNGTIQEFEESLCSIYNWIAE